MENDSARALTQFQWTPQPAAEALIGRLVAEFLTASPLARTLQDRLYAQAGVRFSDMVDHLRLPADAALERELIDAGFERAPEQGGNVFVQPHGIFPRAVLSADSSKTQLAIKVESVADFESVWQTGCTVEGPPLSPMRKARVWSGDGHELWIVERHGFAGIGTPPASSPVEKILHHADQFRRRPRRGDEVAGFDCARELIAAAIADLGVDYTCDLFFAAERDYWQRRNRAAQVQKARQDRLGIGWANHDHHTYRSSREHFARLIGIFEMLGFHCRERFYAGREAGWGAQVLEQPNAGIVIFADVDLSPEELFEDFAHEPLAERHALGTVGLWCGLHGESFLAAGMHHLECQFDFDALATQLQADAGVTVMKPFTDFPYLRQAFTEGERWPVSEDRIARLEAAGRISPEQASAFRREGAIGSHLENLERNAGFKGFNQTGVSEIISATDPRKHLATA